jgi:hypothetical protein
MIDEHLETQLKKFNLTDLAIAELKQKFCFLQIKGITDVDGYKAVKAARITMKTYRVDIDKRRKELTEESRKTVNAINEAAKIVTAKIVPIENYLAEQEQAYEAEKARIKFEKEQAEFLMVQMRNSKLTELGFRLANNVYYASYTNITILFADLRLMSQKHFDNLIEQAESAAKIAIENEIKAAAIEKARKEREEAAQRIEQERLTQQRKEQESERRRLEIIAKDQEAKEAALIAEANRIEKAERERAEKEIADHLASTKKFIENSKAIREECVIKEPSPHNISEILSDMNPELKAACLELIDHPDAKITLTMGDGKNVNIKPCTMKQGLTAVAREIFIDEEYVRKLARNVDLSETQIVEILDYLEQTINDHIDIVIEKAIKLKTML